MSEQKKIVLGKSLTPSEIKDALKVVDQDIKEQKAVRKTYPKQVSRSRGGRPRQFKSDAERQKAGRERRKAA